MEKTSSRKIAREIAMHLCYGYSYSNQSIDDYFANNMTEDHFESMVEDYEIYQAFPDETQFEYIRKLYTGVASHDAELDEYIAKYAQNWKFDRISLTALAIMRVAMYEAMYMDEIPAGVAINEAVEIAKKYEEETTVKFINGILGSFVRIEIG